MKMFNVNIKYHKGTDDSQRCKFYEYLAFSTDCQLQDSFMTVTAAT